LTVEREMKSHLGISEARARLPELAKRLAAMPGRVEYISHRDLDEDLALTTRAHIEYLEALVKELRARNASEFALAGSVLIPEGRGEAEMHLREAATNQGDLFRAKLDELFA
jgi:hypothetical protein